MTILIAIIAALLGTVVGSFLNVVIYRVPRGESLVRPPSRCPSCEREIRIRDNIPIVSWLMLRGRCRDCRAPISVRYPLVEAANGALWVASALRFEEVEEAAFVAVASSVFLALSVIDLEHRRLPNAIVLPATAAALVWVGAYAVAASDLDAARSALIGGVAAFALLFVIAFVSGGMGFGDVKLAGFIGVVCGRFGWEIVIGALFSGFIIGGLVAIALVIAGRKGRKESIPFGPWLAVGAVASLFTGPGPVRAWLGL